VLFCYYCRQRLASLISGFLARDPTANPFLTFSFLLKDGQSDLAGYQRYYKRLPVGISFGVGKQVGTSYIFLQIENT